MQVRENNYFNSFMYVSYRIPKTYIYFLCLLFVFSAGCAPLRINRQIYDPVWVSANFGNKTLKIHMTDGSLYILDSLINSSNRDTVTGYGAYFDQYRDIVSNNKKANGPTIQSAFRIPFSKVALFETNDITGLNKNVLAMTLVGVPQTILSIYCMINPKSCFGSCPTFYAWDGNDTVLMAEGFSSSILRSFEKEDIDMLYNARVTGNSINLKLTNEALETHIIRYADLLMFPRKDNERVFSLEDGGFTQVSEIRSPSACVALEGSCLEAIQSMDQKERFSETDTKNLAAREHIELNFNEVPDGELGLIIGNRQTFLTTFLFYQSLAYMGHRAGNFAASIESGNKSLQRKVDKVWDVLGGIEVFVLDSKEKWIKAGELNEMGPIASDIHLMKLPFTGQKNLKIKLVLTKGLWRLDYLALAKIGPMVEPVRIKPSVMCDNPASDDMSTIFLSDANEPLITLPGDSYHLSYSLPYEPGEYELFLCSKGYYIEWMREPWLAEQNLRKASLLFGFPGMFMKLAAKEFKVIEPTMEENFWKSRYAKKN
jgi:hypothetical protein